VTLRRDHVAGGAFFVVGLFVLGVSGDLPFGTLASPGAGMLPTLVVGLMMAFALVLIAGARRSPPLATIAWSDLPHALRVVLLTAVAVSVYTTLGFLISVASLVFALAFVVERRPILPATAVSMGVTILVYVLFSRLLRTPLPQGLLGF
jgi:hypothetical protein